MPRGRRITILAALMIVLLRGVLWPGFATAGEGPSAKEFFRGKTVELIACSSPGGSFDLVSRTIAPHFKKALGANVIIKNLAEAGGIVGHNTVWKAKPNGLVLGLHTFTSVVFSDFFDASYEPQTDKVTYLAGFGEDSNIAIAKPGIKTAADLIARKGLKFTSTGPTAGRTIQILAVVSGLNLDAKIITGLSSGDTILAVMRGDADATIVTVGSAEKMVREGQATALFTSDKWRSKGKPEVPALTEVAKIPKERMEIVDLVSNVRAGHLIFGPPGMPADRIAFLRKTIATILGQKDAIRDLSKALGYAPDLVPGEEYVKRAVYIKNNEKRLIELIQSQLKKYRD